MGAAQLQRRTPSPTGHGHSTDARRSGPSPVTGISGPPASDLSDEILAPRLEPFLKPPLRAQYMLLARHSNLRYEYALSSQVACHGASAVSPDHLQREMDSGWRYRQVACGRFFPRRDNTRSDGQGLLQARQQRENQEVRQPDIFRPGIRMVSDAAQITAVRTRSCIEYIHLPLDGFELDRLRYLVCRLF